MSLDINKLLDEVEAEVKTLLKSAQDDAGSLKKAEDEKSKKEESKKEESKAEKSALDKAMPDQEGSGYENQAPEASAEQSAPEMSEEAAPAPEASQEGSEDQVEDISQIMQSLDDDMLHELYQKIKMELMGRMQAQEGSADQSQAAPEMEQQTPAPEASPDLAMKSEKTEAETLAKSELKTKEEEINKLKKSLEDYEKGLSEMTDMLKVVLDRPVQRALTDISFVSKDGSDLKKSEVSDEDMKKAVDAISSDRKKLGALTKSEIDTIQDFYAGKNVKDKVLKIVNK